MWGNFSEDYQKGLLIKGWSKAGWLVEEATFTSSDVNKMKVLWYFGMEVIGGEVVTRYSLIFFVGKIWRYILHNSYCYKK